jgi:choline-glycine betaine transporter
MYGLLGLEDASRGERALFVVTAAFVLGLAATAVGAPGVLETVLNAAFFLTLNFFSWWLMLLGFGLFLFGVAFCLSRYGHMRIGGPDATPEFGLFSWFAVIFTVSFGPSILVWGVAEPAAFLVDGPDPSPVAGASTESAALAFMLAHNVLPGLIAWYLPVGLAFGLVALGGDRLKVSAMLDPVLDREAHARLFWVVDVAAVIAIIGGGVTSFGLLEQQVTAIAVEVFGADSTLVSAGVFALAGLFFVADVRAGLQRGIRVVAIATVAVVIALMLALLAAGPTLFTIELTLDAVGVWLDNLFRMMLYTDPLGHRATEGFELPWAHSWTGFWWAWWAAFAVIIGTFVARVSRGRTVRDVFVAFAVLPAVFLVFQHGVLGGLALAPENVDAVTGAYGSGDDTSAPAALTAVIASLPFSGAFGAFFVVALVGYVVTSVDSVAYIVSAINTNEAEPNARNRMAWVGLTLILGAMTVTIEGTEALQAFAPALALPFTLVILAVVYSLAVYARREYPRDGTRPDAPGDDPDS